MSSATPVTAVSSPPKRSWRRFSLRVLFLVVLAAGVFFGWVAYRARFLKSQYAWFKYNNSLTLKPLANEWFWRPLVGDAAVTVRRAVIDRVTPGVFDRVKGWTEAEELLLDGPLITDTSLGFVRGFDQLTLLALENTAVTDAGTWHLAHLRGLKGLYIVHDRNGESASRPEITDASLSNLVRGKDLDEFGVTGPITDEGLLMIVSHSPNLIRLRLDRSRITDKGLATLRSLKKLSQLWLTDNSAIDDAAALELTGVPSLTKVSLEGTRVTQKGAAAIRAKVPGAFVTIERRRHITRTR